MFSFLRPYIFSLDPEAAHDLAIKSLKVNILPKSFFDVEGEELLETDLLNKFVSSNSSPSTWKNLCGKILAFKDLIAKSCATSGSKENI